MLLFNPIKKFFRALQSDATPNQLAMGLVMGMFLGLMPAWFHAGDTLVVCALWWGMLGILLLFNVSITMAIISSIIFGALSAIGLAQLEYGLGYTIIQSMGANAAGEAAGPIGGLVKMIGENSLLSLTALHHWRIMGAVVLWLLLAAPVYFGSRALVEKLRNWLLVIAQTKGMQYIRKSFVLRWTLWFMVGNVLVATVAAGKAGEKLQKAKDQLQDEEKLKAQLKADAEKKDAAAKPADAPAAPDQPEAPAAAATADPTGDAADLEALADDPKGTPLTLIVEEEVTDEKGVKQKKLKIRKKKKIRRLRRSVVAAVAMLVVVPAIALTVAYLYRNQIVKYVIEGPVATQVGMPIKVGAVEVDLGAGSLKLKDVVVGPAPYEGAAPAAEVAGVPTTGPVFHAEELTGAIVPDELFSLRVHIDLQAVTPTLTLVRLPDGRMNYQGPELPREAGELPDSGAQPAEPVLNEAGEQVIDEESGEPVWRDPFTGETMHAATQPVIEPPKEEYDPAKGTTWDEVRKFIDEMIKKYDLDNPEKNAERYEQFQKLLKQYGASAAAQGPAVTEAQLKAQLIGMATYVTNPPALPAPGRPSFWLKSLSLRDVSVRYVDTRPDGDQAIKQEHYTFDLRNITSNRMLIDQPLVVVVGRGMNASTGREMAQAALEHPHVFGKVAEQLIKWETDQQSSLKPVNLMNCLLLRFDETLQLNEIIGLFQGPDDKPWFSSGHIAIHTADPGMLDMNWWTAAGSNWTFIAEGVPPESGKLPDGSYAVPGGEMSIQGSKVEGIVIISLEDVKFNRGAFGLPDFLFDILERFLGESDYKRSWRFALGLTGKFLGPKIRLLNEREVVTRLREVCVIAVQKLAAKGLDELLGKLLDREAFRARYGAGPEEFIVFEASVPGSAEVAAAWTRARGREGNFRNVVTPLLFVGNKKVFLNNLGYNAATVGRAMVVDFFDDKAKLLLGKLLEVLPLPAGGLPEGVTRESLGEGMLDGVAEKLVPDFTIDLAGNLQMDTGASYEARQQAALDQLRFNVAKVTGIVLKAWIDAAAREVIVLSSRVLNGIPAAARPSAYRASMGDIEAALWEGVFESVQPEVLIDEQFNFTVRFSKDDALKTLRDRIVTNTRNVLAKLTDAYVDDLAGEVAKVLGPDVAAKAALDGAEFRAAVSKNVSSRMFPLSVAADGTPNLRVDLRNGMNQLAANLATVLPTIGVKLTDKLAGDASKTIASKLPGALPGGWTADRMLTELRAGLAEAMFPRGCVTVVSNGDAQNVSIKPDTAAMQRKLDSNAATLARALGGDLSTELIGNGVEKICTIFPKLPGGMTRDDVKTDLTAGVGDSVVTGNTVATLAFRPQAAAQALDRNAVKLTRKLAELGLQDVVAPIAEKIVAESKPRQEDYDANQMKVDLASGVGEAIVEGTTLATLKLTPAKAANRLTINALTVARKLGSKVLERMADDIIRPVATPLGGTDAQIREAAAVAAKDVDTVMFPDGSIRIDENNQAQVNAQAEAAKKKLELNARIALAQLVTQLLQHYASDIVKALNEPFMSPEERTHFKDRWDVIAKAGLTDGIGLRFIDTDDAGKAKINDEIRKNMDPAIKDFQADLIIFRCNKLCQDNNVRFTPPLSSSELTQAERDAFYAAKDAVQQMDVIKGFLKRQDRVIDGLGKALGMGPPNLPAFIPQAQRDQAMRDYRNNIRKLIEKW